MKIFGTNLPLGPVSPFLGQYGATASVAEATASATAKERLAALAGQVAEQWRQAPATGMMMAMVAPMATASAMALAKSYFPSLAASVLLCSSPLLGVAVALAAGRMMWRPAATAVRVSHSQEASSYQRFAQWIEPRLAVLLARPPHRLFWQHPGICAAALLGLAIGSAGLLYAATLSGTAMLAVGGFVADGAYTLDAKHEAAQSRAEALRCKQAAQQCLQLLAAKETAVAALEAEASMFESKHAAVVAAHERAIHELQQRHEALLQDVTALLGAAL